MLSERLQILPLTQLTYFLRVQALLFVKPDPGTPGAMSTPVRHVKTHPFQKLFGDAVNSV